MVQQYSATDFSKEHMARALGVALPVSRKQSIEICNVLRGKSVVEAKKLLDSVIAQKAAIPFRRFNRDMGHKPGMAMGRYPVKASSEIKRLLESAESNAQFKGLDTAGLVISHLSVQQAPAVWRHGRQRRRQMKRATIELILKESKKQEKPVKKQTQKTEKPAVKAQAEQPKKEPGAAKDPESKPGEATAPKKTEKAQTDAKPVEEKKAAPEAKEESKKNAEPAKAEQKGGEQSK